MSLLTLRGGLYIELVSTYALSQSLQVKLTAPEAVSTAVPAAFAGVPQRSKPPCPLYSDHGRALNRTTGLDGKRHRPLTARVNTARQPSLSNRLGIKV